MTARQIKRFLSQNLLKVRQPAQYVGNEMNVMKKPWARSQTKICLLYPDRYEVGMSNLAVQLFYDLINRHSPHLLERAFIPDDDMTELLLAHQIPLFSLESKRPLSDFDILAISVSTELSFTNTLLALELAGIAFYAKQRLASDEIPIIIAGGGGVANPLPMSLFFDGFVMGDGEDVLEEICDIVYDLKVKKGLGKIEILTRLNQLEYLYLPLFQSPEKVIKRHHFKNFTAKHYLTKPLVPLLKVVHDRFSVEIMRGCPRKCRFCQASYMSKPVRVKPLEPLAAQAHDIISNTGYGEISLSSLSSSDYPRLIKLIQTLQEDCESRQVVLSLPSVRMDSLSEDLSIMTNKIRQSGVTLAPEAGSQFLRDVLGKDITEEDIFRTVLTAAKNSKKSIKLYAMIGLPREEQSDLEALVDLAWRLLEHIKPLKNKLTINVSNFVPKPYTPFQWVAQADIPALTAKLNYLKANLRHPQLEFRWTDPQVSIIEGVLSRGIEKTGELILAAYRQGARFDAWFDHFKFSHWQKAAEQIGFDLSQSLKLRSTDESLPWEFIDMGISRERILREYDEAMALPRI